MIENFNIQFENAIRFLCKYLPISNAESRKPILFHDIRVGVSLYEKDYASDIVLAGFLHDVIEWSDSTEQMLRDEFGDAITKLVLANTKNDSIADKEEKTNELIQRCVRNGMDALIIKSADIIDSFKWYSGQNNKDELLYCMRNANAIFKWKPEDFNDPIFEELKYWQSKFAGLN